MPYERVVWTVLATQLYAMRRRFSGRWESMGGADHPVFSALDIPLYLEGAQEYNWLNISNSYTRLNIECINKLSAYACFAFPHGAAPRAAERSHSQHTSPQVDFTPSKPSRGGSKQAEEADPHTRQTR